MKFDPQTFVKIANRSGVKLTLNDNGTVHFLSSGHLADALLLITARKHKRKLLRYLKNEREKYKQVDLFDSLPMI